ncbi:hypothetical protein M2308_000904 [Rhizobium leguminosarum]|nr:hypothetical protein [Rhizobium leguminosarum]
MRTAQHSARRDRESYDLSRTLAVNAPHIGREEKHLTIALLTDQAPQAVSDLYVAGAGGQVGTTVLAVPFANIDRIARHVVFFEVMFVTTVTLGGYQIEIPPVSTA